MDSGFALEKELVHALRDGSPAALNVDSGWFHVIRELAVRERVADLVLVHAASEPESRRARMSYFEASILSVLLERGDATAPVIADRLYSSTDAVEARATKLARLGLLNIGPCGTLRPTGRHLAGAVRIIAIEAKLARWREAVEQASRYRAFANQAYIAMPGAVFDGSDAVFAACCNAGVGAIAVSADGRISVALEAPEAECQTPEWVRLVSSFVGIAHRSNVSRQMD